MNPATLQQWIQKAEHDWKIALDELATPQPVADMVCFHLQQCCEKYLKAFLICHDQPYPRTHRLEVLIYLCGKLDPEFQLLMEWGADRLSRYAASIRYGEDFYVPTLEETQQAVGLKKFVSLCYKNSRRTCRKNRIPAPVQPLSKTLFGKALSFR